MSVSKVSQGALENSATKIGEWEQGNQKSKVYASLCLGGYLVLRHPTNSRQAFTTTTLWQTAALSPRHGGQAGLAPRVFGD